MVQGPNLTTDQRYIFVESIDNFFMNFWHELWKSPGEFSLDNGDVIWILGELRSESVFDLKCLDRYPLIEPRTWGAKMLTSSKASPKDNKSSGAFRISSIISGSWTTVDNKPLQQVGNLEHCIQPLGKLSQHCLVRGVQKLTVFTPA